MDACDLLQLDGTLQSTGVLARPLETLLPPVPLTGDDGKDRLIGGEDDDDISGLGGNDILKGEGGNDRIAGGTGADELHGGTGRDRLFGGGGADTLKGGDGSDVLTGGGGADIFILTWDGAGDDAKTWGRDIVTDFNLGTDHVSLLFKDLPLGTNTEPVLSQTADGAVLTLAGAGRILLRGLDMTGHDAGELFL